jgi:GntR family transcriptional regulator
MAVDEVYEKLKSRIERRELEPGALLPSEQALCEEFTVSRGTIRSVLKRIAQEGYLDVVQGRRRVVRVPEPLPLVKLSLPGQRRDPSFGEYLKQLGEITGWVPQDDTLRLPRRIPWYNVEGGPRLNVGEVRTRLGLDGQDEVTWFLRRRFAKGSPIALQWVVVPAAVVDRVDPSALYPGGLTKLYHDRYSIVRATVDAHYRATMAAKDEARHLRIERGAPLIEEHRVSYCFRQRVARGVADSAVPYEYLVSLYNDRVSLDFSWADEGSATNVKRKGHSSPQAHRQ